MNSTNTGCTTNPLIAKTNMKAPMLIDVFIHRFEMNKKRVLPHTYTVTILSTSLDDVKTVLDHAPNLKFGGTFPHVNSVTDTTVEFTVLGDK